MAIISALQKRQTPLSLGVIVSVLLAIVFFTFQYVNPTLLTIESRWIAVTLAPLIIGLLVGGYLKSFKGFGIEFIANLQKPIRDIPLTAKDSAMLHGFEKGNTSQIHKFSTEEKDAIERLTIREGKKDYYDTEALVEYVKTLTKLRFIEIVNDKEDADKFVALLPIEFLGYGNSRCNIDRARDFLRSLENRSVPSDYSYWTISDTITLNTGLLSALKLMRQRNTESLAVVNNCSIFQGLLLSSSLEKRVADDVINAQKIETTTDLDQ